MGLRQQATNRLPGSGPVQNREEKAQSAQRPAPLNVQCECVQSPCNCNAFAINESAYSAVSKPAPKEAEKTNSEDPSFLEKAADEVGEIFDAVVDAGKSIISGGVESVTKPLAKATGSVVDEAKGFLSGLNDTVRFGLVAIAIALMLALFLGLIFVGGRR